MPQPFQPDFPTPRIRYKGGRKRVHGKPWATDQGVPNEADYNPDESDLKFPESGNLPERFRPENWKRGEEDVASIKLCRPGLFVSAVTDSDEGQTIYLKQDGNATCYYGNVSVPPLGFVGANPPACGGASPSAVTGIYIPIPYSPLVFRCWWNIWIVCGPAPPDTTIFQIFNNGTCTLDVNGTVLNNGDGFTFNGVAQAPGLGDQSAYALGTTFTVTIL